MLSKVRALVFWILLVLSMLLVIIPCITRAAEPSLETVLDNCGFPDIELLDPPVETFAPGTYNITLYAEFAGYHDRNNLSWYRVGTSDFNLIFDGSDGNSGYTGPTITRTFTSNGQFGLCFGSPEGRFYTQTSRNPDDPEQHAKVYQNSNDPGMFLIGFENKLGGYDRDFNDMVISLKRLPSPVGGVWVPVNKFELLAPWIGLASFLIIPIVAVSVACVKRAHAKQ